MENSLESSRSSDIQGGSLVNAELGGLSNGAVAVVHGFEPGQVVAVMEDQPDGMAGAVTASKFWEHCAVTWLGRVINNRNADTKEMYNFLIAVVNWLNKWMKPW
jgi:hypothetical protein